MKRRQRFAPVGPCAVAPHAFGAFFDFEAAPASDIRDDGTAVVSVSGPLMHHEDWCCDSYDAIKARVADALAAPGTRALVLSIDSPGGLVDGCFDTALEIRAMAKARGVPLHAYVDGMACSAAYGLACAAQDITIPSTGTVGSIGVINALVDARAQDAMFGVQLELVASGARKTDGNPHTAITDGARAAMRSDVMTLAEMFFAHVAAARPRASADAVRAMEAGLVIGAAAVPIGLADRVATLDELLALIAGGQMTTAADAAGKDPTMATAKTEASAPRAGMGADMDAACVEACNACAAACTACAKDPSAENMAACVDACKACITACSGAPAEGGAEVPAEDAAKAETPPPFKKKDDEPDGDEAKALSARMAKLEAGEATRAAAAVSLERSTLLASRPDFTPEHLATLATAPIELVRAQVANIPRGVARKPAAAASVTGTRGEGQGDGSFARQAPEAASAMARAMGLESMVHTGVVDNGNVLILGATVPGGKKA